MKTVLLNDEGYTADGEWRLVKIPNNPITAAQHDFYHMIAASPAPALPADGYVQTGINSPFNACMYREDCKLQKERIAELEARNQELQGELDEWKQAAQTAAFTVEVLSAELAELRRKMCAPHGIDQEALNRIKLAVYDHEHRINTTPLLHVINRILITEIHPLSTEGLAQMLQTEAIPTSTYLPSDSADFVVCGNEFYGVDAAIDAARGVKDEH